MTCEVSLGVAEKYLEWFRVLEEVEKAFAFEKLSNQNQNSLEWNSFESLQNN